MAGAISPQTVFLAAIAVIALGYTIRKTGLVTRETGNALARIVLNVTLPAIILQTVPDVDFRVELLFLPLLALVHAAVGFALTMLVFRNSGPGIRGLAAISMMGFNNGLFAFPIVYEIWGAPAIQRLAVFDVGNGLVIIGINYVVAGWFGAAVARARGDGVAVSADILDALKTAARVLITSVPMITFVFALGLNLTGWRLPAPMARTVDVLAAANGALGLLVLGIFQSFTVRRADWHTILPVLGLRYAIGIAFSVVTVLILGDTLILQRVLGIAFILPVAMLAIPYSVQFGLDARLVTTITNLSIVISFVFMWGVVLLTG